MSVLIVLTAYAFFGYAVLVHSVLPYVTKHAYLIRTFTLFILKSQGIFLSPCPPHPLVSCWQAPRDSLLRISQGCFCAPGTSPARPHLHEHPAQDPPCPALPLRGAGVPDPAASRWSRGPAPALGCPHRGSAAAGAVPTTSQPHVGRVRPSQNPARHSPSPGALRGASQQDRCRCTCGWFSCSTRGKLVAASG